MFEQTIKFQYKKGIVVGDYSFSAKNNIIILSGYIERLENNRVREAIKYEAQIARSFYVDEVNRLKSEGEKVNTFYVKSVATKIAKEEVRIKFSDIWDEIEITRNLSKALITSSQSSVSKTSEELADNNFLRYKNIELLVIMLGSDNTTQSIASETDPKRLIDTLNAIFKNNWDCITNKYIVRGTTNVF